MTLLEQARVCVEQIENDDYYPARWVKVKHVKPLEQCNREELLKPFQDLWEILPDSPAIRCGPFFKICDLAEEYCFGEES